MEPEQDVKKQVLEPKSEGVFMINTESDVDRSNSDIAESWPSEVDVTREPILDYGQQAFVLKHLMSAEECQELIDLGEMLGFEKIPGAREDYRSATRICLNAPALADHLFSRVRAQLTCIRVQDDPKALHVQGVRLLMQGTWQPEGLNPLFRLCRYEPGGHFAPHFDGHYVQEEDVRSLQTLMIYLNGPLQGGSTNFIDERQQLYMDSAGRYCAEETNILTRVHPETGLALLFNHHRLHEGAALSCGVKYILRTDVMFRRTEKPEVAPREMEALRLLQEAENLEASGENMRAVTLYRRAYKLSPQLEFS